MIKLYQLVALASLIACSQADMFTPLIGQLTQITASVNYLWGIDKETKIYICVRPCEGNWIQIDGAAISISVDDSEVYAIDPGYNVFKRPIHGMSQNGWIPVPTIRPQGMVQLSASGNGFVWGIGTTGTIWKCKKPCDGEWEDVGGEIKQLDGGGKYVYGVNAVGDIWSIGVEGIGNWRHIPGKAQHISASNNAEVFAISTDGTMYRCRKPCIGEWQFMGGQNLKQCDASIHKVFAVDNNADIYSHYL